MRQKIHIAIVTHQTVANLIPVLVLKPDYVYLLCSKVMMSNGKTDQLLQAIFTIQGYSRDNVKILLDFPDHRYEAMRIYLIQQFNVIKNTHTNNDECEYTLNMTGGNKLMVRAADIAATEILYASVVYVDTYYLELETMPSTAIGRSFVSRLGSELSLKLFFKAYGFEIHSQSGDSWRASAKNNKAKVAVLLKLILNKEFITLLANLNGIAASVNLQQSLKHTPSKDHRYYLKKLNDAGIINWSKVAPQNIDFISPDHRIFFRGMWLEQHAWQKANELEFHHVGANVEIRSSAQSNQHQNEFDTVIVHNNRMLIIECKSGNIATNTLYKLDSLAKLRDGSKFVERMLLTANKLDESSNFTSRASGMGIKVVSANELTQALQDWKTRVSPRRLNSVE